MRLVFKILCIFFAIGTLGQFLDGNIFPIGIILTFVFGYFGWREKREPDFDEVQ